MAISTYLSGALAVVSTRRDPAGARRERLRGALHGHVAGQVRKETGLGAGHQGDDDGDDQERAGGGHAAVIILPNVSVVEMALKRVHRASAGTWRERLVHELTPQRIREHLRSLLFDERDHAGRVEHERLVAQPGGDRLGAERRVEIVAGDVGDLHAQIGRQPLGRHEPRRVRRRQSWPRAAAPRRRPVRGSAAATAGPRPPRRHLPPAGDAGRRPA